MNKGYLKIVLVLVLLAALVPSAWAVSFQRAVPVNTSLAEGTFFLIWYDGVLSQRKLCYTDTHGVPQEINMQFDQIQDKVIDKLIECIKNDAYCRAYGFNSSPNAVVITDVN